jgi:mono/diheme cytochrome c family protein
MLRSVCPALVFLLSSLPACAAAGEEADFFEKRVRPVLVEKCFSCHSAEAKKQRGGLKLDSREALSKGGDNGPVIVAGQPDRSRLVEAIRYGNEKLQMPPKGRLPERDVAAFEAWVRRGAFFPATTAKSESKTVPSVAEGRKFWSFQMPRPQSLPAVRRQAWSRQRIDHFVLAELEKRNLTPSPAAARGVLIRRATFDLVGLPPTPSEVEAFVSDPAPDAYERLVERLLSSPHYGERWGRHWLDLVRYCDIAEQWFESKGQPWLYRDWVVRSFNADVPFDRFVLRQFAADLMPGLDPGERAALGFLGLSPTYWKELKLDKEVIKTVVAEEWEERIQTVTGALLGLTVACARCHDHKYDPITMQDYYALAGVFASIRQIDRPLVDAGVEQALHHAQEQLKSWQTELEKLQPRAAKEPDARKQADELRAKIDQLRKSTPDLENKLVPGIVDASLLVLADGEHRTKLEYKPGMAQDVAMQVRGNPTNRGPVVPRRFLAVLSPGSPTPFRQGSGRLELARAIVTEGAPLTARVFVNRVWRHHFGAGLVETTSDFGVQGDRPTHPELLDDLASRFMRHGWSLKWLQREIMLSAVYQQASNQNPDMSALDPANRWLWRMNRRRLDIEAWRDAMLAVNGTLQRGMGGPSLDLGVATNRRRTIYGVVKRRELTDLLRLHDFPDPVGHSPSRIPTTTPLQQLFVLNSPFIQQQAASLVERLKTEMPANHEARIRRAYQLLFGREPTSLQLTLGSEFLTPDTDDAWRQYAQVLLGSNEFLFVD